MNPTFCEMTSKVYKRAYLEILNRESRSISSAVCKTFSNKRTKHLLEGANVDSSVAWIILVKLVVLKMLINPVGDSVLCVVGDDEIFIAQRLATSCQLGEANSPLDAVPDIHLALLSSSLYGRQTFLKTHSVHNRFIEERCLGGIYLILDPHCQGAGGP